MAMQFREKLTKGKDVVDPKNWAGAIPAAFGIAPRVRIGANRWLVGGGHGGYNEDHEIFGYRQSI